MSFLAGLHGTIAGIFILAVLFADEAGVPIPVAPNEILLLIAGVLIQTRALSAWIFYPAAAVVMTAGMIAGYSWAQAVGQLGLEGLVRRVGAGGVYAKAVGRVQAAGPLGIGIARLLPGVRPWATLISGATRFGLRRFLLGALPSLLLWEVTWTTLGILVGVPAEHLLGGFERLILRGVLLLILGAGGYAGVRRLRAEGVLALHRRGFQLPLVAVLSGGAIASILAGALAIGRGLGHLRGQGWIDLLVILVLLAADAGITLLQRHRRGLPANGQN